MPKWSRAMLWGLCFSGMAWFWWYGGHYPIRHIPMGKEPLNPGTFGDSFGFINSFFSSMGFMVATIALVMQIRQTNRTIELAKDTKYDEHRKLQMDVLTKLHTDTGRLHYAGTMLVVRSPNTQGGTSVEAAAHLAEAIYALIGNMFPLEMVFGESSFALRTALMDYADSAREAFRDPNDAQRKEARDTAMEKMLPLIRALWGEHAE